MESEGKSISDLLKENQITVKNSKFKVCISCNKKFKKRKELKNHGCKNECLICGNSFKDLKYLEFHLKTIHDIGKKSKCCYCEDEVYDLQKHKRQFHSMQSCSDCGKKVKDLKSHFQTIHGPEESKRFGCEFCEKRFILKEKLQAHYLVHSEERGFYCQYKCGFASKAKGNVTKHEKCEGRACTKFQKRVQKKSNTQSKDPLEEKETTVDIVVKEEVTDSGSDDLLISDEMRNDNEMVQEVVEKTDHPYEVFDSQDENDRFNDEHDDIMKTQDSGVLDDSEEKQSVSNDCPFCKKEFDKIEHHILLSHMGLNIYKFVCNICGKEFETKETLLVHKALHFNNTEYSWSVLLWIQNLIKDIVKNPPNQ